MNRIRFHATAVALTACFAILGAVGCGGGSGGDGAALKKADAVTVTYYYLPG